MQYPGREAYTTMSLWSRSFPGYGTVLASVFGMLDGKYVVEWDSNENETNITVPGVLFAHCVYTREGRWVAEIHAPSLTALLRSNGYKEEE